MCSLSVLSRLVSSSEISILSQALLLLLIAAFCCRPNRVISFVISGPSSFRTTNSQSLQTTHDDDDDDFSSSSEEDETCSLSSQSSSEDDVDTVHNHSLNDSNDFWCDIEESKNVVRLWDGLGSDLGFHLETFLAGERSHNPSPAAFPALMAYPTMDKGRNLILSLWDRRMESRAPAICAEWWWKDEKQAARVQESDMMNESDSGASVICDLRKVTESEEDGTW